MATNMERLNMMIKGLDSNLNPTEKEVYLNEAGAEPDAEYDNTSISLHKIEKAALSALEDIANNISYMKDYKSDSDEFKNFHGNLRKRIDQLRERIESWSPEPEPGQEQSNIFFFYK